MPPNILNAAQTENIPLSLGIFRTKFALFSLLNRNGFVYTIYVFPATQKFFEFLLPVCVHKKAHTKMFSQCPLSSSLHRMPSRSSIIRLFRFLIFFHFHFHSAAVVNSQYLFTRSPRFVWRLSYFPLCFVIRSWPFNWCVSFLSISLASRPFSLIKNRGQRRIGETTDRFVRVSRVYFCL